MEQNICMLYDVDGFVVNKRFYVRELAIVPLTQDIEARRFGFDLECFLQPSIKEWGTIRWLQSHLHGLSFKVVPGEIVYAAEEFDAIVLFYYQKYRTIRKDMVGYKGDSKKNALVSLGIPCTNIEKWKCPKLSELPPTPGCKFHFGGVDRHCPLAKVTAFKRWMMLR